MPATSFSCQRCRQPVLLAPTLNDDASTSSSPLNQSTYDLLQSEAALVREVRFPNTPPPPPSTTTTAISHEEQRIRSLRHAGAHDDMRKALLRAAEERRQHRSTRQPPPRPPPPPVGATPTDPKRAGKQAASDGLHASSSAKATAIDGDARTAEHGRSDAARSTDPEATAASSAAKPPPPTSDPSVTTTSKPPPPPPPPPPASSSAGSKNLLSSRLSLTASLFDLLSSSSAPNASALALDHPLCKECTDVLLELMADQLAQLRRERDAYLAFVDEVSGRGAVTAAAAAAAQGEGEAAPVDAEKMREKIDELERVAEEAMRQLREAEAERLEAERELEELAEEERKLEEEEKRFWHQYSSLQTELESLGSRRASLLTSLSHDSAQLTRLQLTNVWNDAFCIGHEGGFATINGLRFGRLPHLQPSEAGAGGGGSGGGGAGASKRGSSTGGSASRGGNVGWLEINAAWGQTTLLLATLARKCNFRFEGYLLHPRGNFSTIEKLSADAAAHDTNVPTGSGVAGPASAHASANSGNLGGSGSGSSAGGSGTGGGGGSGGGGGGSGTIYELHGSGDWQIGRVFQSRRFDHGMVAFLECLRQFGEWAQARDETLRLPHVINKDRIGEASIRLQFGSDETWTRALRHVLLTLKVLLSWAVNQHDDGGGDGEGDGEGEGEEGSGEDH